MTKKEIKKLKKLNKEELIKKVIHWKEMYEDLNEYIEATYDDYA